MKGNWNVDLDALGSKIDREARYDTLQASVYFQEISKFPELPKGKEELMAILAAAGYREARDSLVESNLRLVVSIATMYKRQGLSLMDLIQEGNIGLIQAAQTFDYRRGVRFRKYAIFLIHRAIRRAIAKRSQLVYIPEQVLSSARRLQRYRKQYIQQYHKEPRAEILTQALGLDKEEITWLKRIVLLELNWLHAKSLEEPIDQDNEEVFEDLIEDKKALSPITFLVGAVLSQELDKALNQLSNRKKDILKLRYGLEDSHPRTLQDVARVFNITRERTRQIAIRAIMELREEWRQLGEFEQLRKLWLKHDIY